MMEELIVTGYCRMLDGNRVLCCEEEDNVWVTDCLYPNCDFASNCRVLENAREKLGDTHAFRKQPGR